MTCPICFEPMKPVFTAQVLHKYSADYEVCNTCGFLRAKQPYWLEEAYSDAIAAADTGLVVRNNLIASKVAAVLYWAINERGKGQYIDIAGGYGMLTRLMRDLGFNFYWKDKYCDNLLAQGFEYSKSHGVCKGVTAIEVLEHVTDPVKFVNDALVEVGAQMIIFTTELYEREPPHPEAWWYYSFPTGQHIGFYRKKTLEVLGARLGLSLSSANGLHILSKEPVNNYLLKFLTNQYISQIGTWWIRRKLYSKTMSDHELMLKNIE